MDRSHMLLGELLAKLNIRFIHSEIDKSRDEGKGSESSSLLVGGVDRLVERWIGMRVPTIRGAQ